MGRCSKIIEDITSRISKNGNGTTFGADLNLSATEGAQLKAFDEMELMRDAFSVIASFFDYEKSDVKTEYKVKLSYRRG